MATDAVEVAAQTKPEPTWSGEGALVAGPAKKDDIATAQMLQKAIGEASGPSTVPPTEDVEMQKPARSSSASSRSSSSSGSYYTDVPTDIDSLSSKRRARAGPRRQPPPAPPATIPMQIAPPPGFFGTAYIPIMTPPNTPPPQAATSSRTALNFSIRFGPVIGHPMFDMLRLMRDMSGDITRSDEAAMQVRTMKTREQMKRIAHESVRKKLRIFVKKRVFTIRGPKERHHRRPPSPSPARAPPDDISHCEKSCSGVDAPPCSPQGEARLLEWRQREHTSGSGSTF